MLLKEAVQEFRAIYKKEFGVMISESEAARRAGKLLELYKAVLSPSKTGVSENLNINESRNKNS